MCGRGPGYLALARPRSEVAQTGLETNKNLYKLRYIQIKPTQ